MVATTERVLDPAQAIYDYVLPARQPWSKVITKGQVLRIVDLEGNQAVDTLIYNAHDPSERYSAPDTVVRQGNIFITTGTQLISNLGNVLMTVIADTCGRHDTLGGACSMESNSVRYGLHKKHLHACVENFLLELSKYGLHKRDLVSNINFFMNVPVTADGRLEIVDGISAPGKYVDLRAEMDVMVLISNCPQINNPCNAYNPTPIRLLVWDAA
ncbi:MAG: urea carboxylase-associated family protein [Gloeomargarita sp. SKYG116]|nr:urea carboxylase-associated family protein [Gloeomargarita sp. SKYG116]MCS7291898.1 urea carboxylase-associated family protein [Gloeomargarita sp. SKYB120]MDW8177458.1 urea carboxylase-associated family protein [Gloeomargarita sp. SKYBB_i_bin120]MDW8400643.1 urea carboxylase-associated family protein [Gloeomargarita sp. SKYGB_i_bin116]